MSQEAIPEASPIESQSIFLSGYSLKSWCFRPIFVLAVIYAVFFIFVPILVFFTGKDSHYFIKLSGISFLSTGAVVFGYYISHSLGVLRNVKLVISPSFYVRTVSGVFFIYVFYVFYSFGGIPLISVFSGNVDPDIIRGEFFKGREGIDQVVIYIGALLIYIFVPFAVLVSYEYKLSGRLLFLTFSLFYCVLTLQKALLLNLLIPTFYYLFVTGRVGFVKIFLIFMLLVGYFVLAINVSGHAELDGTMFTFVDFFSSNYIPNSAVDYFIWRSIAVPVYTSVDTLIVFDEWMNSQFLMGGSSSMLSALFGVERINIEKIVFEYQFGGFNFFANANAYFAVGLFTDFGYIGLVTLSFMLGMGFATVDKVKSVALCSMAFLLVYLLFNASVIGTLLSSGYVYLFFHAVFIKFQEFK